MDVAEFGLERVGDVCQSLVENALQTTKDGPVTVSARPLPSHEEGSNAGLGSAVSDIGAGMEPTN